MYNNYNKVFCLRSIWLLLLSVVTVVPALAQTVNRQTFAANNTSQLAAFGSNNTVVAENIYTAAQMGNTAGSITQIKLPVVAPTAAGTVSVAIYMRHVPYIGVHSTVQQIGQYGYPYEALTTAYTVGSGTPVFNGNVTVPAVTTGSDTVRITLSTPFNYNGFQDLGIFYYRVNSPATPTASPAFTFAANNNPDGGLPYTARYTANVATPVLTTNAGNSNFKPNASFVISRANLASIAANLRVATTTNTYATGSTLTVVNSASAFGVTYQWQNSSDNSSWLDIPSATSVTYVASVDGYYRCKFSRGGSDIFSNSVLIGAPATASAGDATRCGDGVVNLSASGAGSNIDWVSPTGGPILATGSTYSPNITTTTSFRAINYGISPSPAMQGMCPLPSSRTQGGYLSNSTYHTLFNVLNSNGITLSSVDIITTLAPTAVNRNYTIEVQNSSGVAFATVNYAAPSSYVPGTVMTIPLNVYVPSGSNYRIALVAQAAGCIYTNTVGTAPTWSFPQTITGEVSVTGNNVAASFAIYFYNLRIKAGTKTVTTVTGTVNAPPAQSGTTTVTNMCSNALVSATLGVTNTVDYDQIAWTPTGGVNGVPLAQANSFTPTVSPNQTTTYSFVSTNSITGCQSSGTVTVTVDPAPITNASSPSSLTQCPGAVTPVNAFAIKDQIKQIGTGTTSNGNLFRGLFASTRSQHIYTAAELSTAGITGAGYFNKVAFNVTNKASSSAYTNFTISVKHTTASTFTTTNFETGLTQVFTGSFTTALGWNTITFNTPFFYNGTDNLLIQICFFNAAGMGGSDNVEATNVTNSGLFFTGNPTDACGSATGAQQNPRPNLRMNGGALSTITWSGAGLSFSSASTDATDVTMPGTPGTYPATIFVSDGVCSATSSVTFNVTSTLPAPVIASTATSGCGTTSVTLSKTSGPLGDLQWQSAPSNTGPWSDVAGQTATTYAPSVSTTTFYRLNVTCPGSGTAAGTNSNVIQVTINPDATPTGTDNARCGTGSVPLSAALTNGNLMWFPNTGGARLATGTTYTPTLSTTTSYKVLSVVGATTVQAGRPDFTGLTSLAYYINESGIVFDVTNSRGAFIQSVDVQFNPGDVGSNYVLEIRNSSNVTLSSITVPIAVGGVFSTVPINVWLPTGTGYRMVKNASSPSSVGGTGGATYPITTTGYLTVTSGISGGVTTAVGYFNYYNLRVNDGCYTVTPATVTATINTPPTLTVTPNQDICRGSSVNLSATGSGYVNFAWTNGGSLSATNISNPVATPTTDVTYTVTADDGNPDPLLRCTSIGQVTIGVNEKPQGQNGSAAQICSTVPNQLTVSASSRYLGESGTGVAFNALIFGGSADASYRNQFIMTAAELTAMGFSAGSTLSGIQFQTNATNATAPITGFTLRVGPTSTGDFAGGSMLTQPTTTVFSGTVNPTAFSFYEITFATGIVWNGTSNLLFEACYFGASAGETFIQGTVFTPSRCVDATNAGCSASGAIFQNRARPNIKLRGGTLTYSWAANNALTAGGSYLSATNIADPVFTSNVPGSYSYVVTITDAVGCTNTFPVNFSLVAPGLWTGAVDNELGNANNWICNIAPTTAGVTPIIPFRAFNGANITVSNPLTLKKLTVQPLNGIIINIGQTLTIDSMLTVDGAVTAQGVTTGTLAFSNAGGAAILAGSGTVNVPNVNSTNLELRTGMKVTTSRFVASGNTSFNTGSTVTISDSLSLGTGAGTLTNNGSLTLTSTATTASRIGKMTAAQNIVGNITQQGFVPSSQALASGGWFMMGTPIKNKTIGDILAFSPGSQNFGTPQATVMTFDGDLNAPSLGSYVPATASSNPMNPGVGFRIFLRRGSFFSGQQNGTYNLTGEPNLANTADVDLPVKFGTASPWNLVANPLSSAVNWDHPSWTKTNIDNNIAVFRGAAFAWAQYSGGVSNPSVASGGIDGNIPINQGFFVKANAASPVLKVGEGAKVPTFRNVRSAANNLPMVRVEMSNGSVTDGAVVVFRRNSTRGYESSFDAYKLTGPVLAMSVLPEAPGVRYSISSQPLAAGNDVVALAATSTTSGAHTLTFSDMANLPAGVSVSLRDNFLNTLTPVSDGFVYNFSVTSAAASQGNNRFELVFNSPITSVTPDALAANVTIYPNPVALGNSLNIRVAGLEGANARVRVLDALGRAVVTDQFAVSTAEFYHAVNTEVLPRGVYSVVVEAASQRLTQKLVIE